MLRLSNRRVHLDIGPGELRASLYAGWPRRERLEESSAGWNETPPEAPHAAGRAGASASAGFGPQLDGVLEGMAASARIEGSALDVEVSDALVHLDVVQGAFAGFTGPQLAAVAAACVRELLGESGEENEIRWQLQSDEKHLLICALPLAVLSVLRDCAARHTLRLRRLHPRFALRWNRHHKKLGSGFGVFASTDDEHAVIAVVRNGVIEVLSSNGGPAGYGSLNEGAAGPDRLSGEAGPDASRAPTRLDMQVDRLVASLGIDAATLEHFVAVRGADLAPQSSRWTSCPSGAAEG